MSTSIRFSHRSPAAGSTVPCDRVLRDIRNLVSFASGETKQRHGERPSRRPGRRSAFRWPWRAAGSTSAAATPQLVEVALRVKAHPAVFHVTGLLLHRT